ncbi:importin-11 [Hyalella azteca]|uniref:Importin-11 n=1 Tax=Hyalella azteca TaxID=294128 RepID=A0A979FSI1_HYAAZ|nr:importin-11 [Hyalella azteca]
MHDRRKFQDISSKLFPDLHALYKVEVEHFFGPAESAPEGIVVSLHRAHYCLKILRQMATYGFKSPSDVPQVAEFYRSVCEQSKAILLFRKQHEGDELKGISEKYANLLMKCLLELLENYPYCFLNYLANVLSLVTTLVFTDDGNAVLYERFTVQCLCMIKSILDCPEYQVNKIVEETKNPEALHAYRIKSEFFTTTVLEQICHRLITQYFLLSREDLEIWESDPEGFCTEVEGGDSWKFSLRPATECLFKKMFHDYREPFTRVVLSLMTDAVKMTDSSNFQGLLSKDAVYNAIGLTSFDIVEEVDFDMLFTTHLVHELKITDSNYRILRRRIIWLVGQWTDVRFSAENRPLLYEACIHLLSTDSDFVVRYYTAMTLRTAIDDFDFDRKCFVPYLSSVVTLLFNLLKEAKECDVKMQILNVLSILIEVMGVEVREAAGPLVQFLPQLWHDSEHHNLLRCAILTTLTHLVSCMGRDSIAMHDFLLKVLHLSTDTTHASHVYLLEDGLQLWYCVLENTPSLPAAVSGCVTGAESNNLPEVHSNLLQLYANLLPVLDASTDYLQGCTQITTAYILLCPTHFLHRYGRELLQVLGGLASDLKAEGLVLVLRMLEAVVRTCSVDGVLLVTPLVAKISSNLLLDETSTYPMMVSAQLSLLSRILLVHYDSFTAILQLISQHVQEADEAVLTALLRVWCSRLSVVTPDERRKLAALGLCRLIAVHHPALLAVWSRAAEAIVEVIYDVTNEDTKQDKLVISDSDYGSVQPDEANSSASSSSAVDPSYLAALAEDDDAPRVAYSEDPLAVDPDCEHSKRRHALARIDPVHNFPLQGFFGNALMEFQRAAPPETVQHVMANLTDEVRAVIRDATSNLSFKPS